MNIVITHLTRRKEVTPLTASMERDVARKTHIEVVENRWTAAVARKSATNRRNDCVRGILFLFVL